jgi:hypothetical protein
MPQYINPSEEKIFHSHSYADAAHGTNIGATSIESFEKRLAVDRNRQAVQRYHHSLLARSPDRLAHQAPLSDRYERSVGARRPERGSAHGSNAGVRPSQPSQPRFHEPPTRGYNPYQ